LGWEATDMAKITVSYRREDSEAITGRIFDRLVGRFGKTSVFRDIDNIPPGVDFRTHIDEALETTDVLLVVIGRRWLGSAKPGNARIHDADDPVRIEVETALKRGISVIPVLVNDTKMPTAAQLPKTLKDFVFRNAVRVDSGQDFDHHTDRLLRAMDRTLERSGKPASASVATPSVPSAAPAMPVQIAGNDGDAAIRIANPSVATLAVEKARPEWGGYTRASVSELIGSYLVLRPAFKKPSHVVAYATDIAWDAEMGGLTFQERDRADARHTHRGHVQIPNLSMYMYLVSGENGWLRSVTLSVLDVATEMHGVLASLHNIAGAMYVPVATPVVYLRRANFDADCFGEIKPSDAHHERYFELLRHTVANTYVQMILPGAS
jgi:TIR domain